MTRALIIIQSHADKERAVKWCRAAPAGMRISFKHSKRTLDQNSLFWACLTDVAAQVEHNGQKYTADIWKLLFMDAFGREMKFVPSIDGKHAVPIGQSSSDLSREEMSDLITFILAFGAERGVTFHLPEMAA